MDICNIWDRFLLYLCVSVNVFVQNIISCYVKRYHTIIYYSDID